ncbi:unnamed protein product, partial [Meganyctiphanes norvegica]
VVRLGEHDYKDDMDGLIVEDVAVEEVKNHPDYTSSQAHHDIALIKLAKQVVLRREIRPICLPWGSKAKLALEDKQVTITGWGISVINQQPGSFLNVVNVTVFEKEKCATLMSNRPDFKVTFPRGYGEEFVCAGDELGNDSCQ